MSDGERLEAIRHLLRLTDAYSLEELVVDEGGLRVTIRGGGSVATRAAAESPASEASPPPPSPAEPESQFHTIASPMTGVFYRAASPDVPPYVEVGDRVEEGQTVGLIEAMKVFSEIPADHPGRVVQILAATGRLVSQGDSLILLDPEG